MGSIESYPRDLFVTPNDQGIRPRNHSWRVTKVALFQTTVTINKEKYTFGRTLLGKGAFGEVYPARRMTDGANVAIKVVSVAESSAHLPALIESFLNEVKQSMKLSLQSKHVVQMFDFDFHPSGLAFIVMERGDQDLEKLLTDKPTLPIYQQKLLWKQIVDILLVLHRHSIVHLDLKPSNLVLFGDRLKLVDLGIAKKANSRGKAVIGTYGFSAPEVHLASRHSLSYYTSKADIWSVGAILYWINYGGVPKYDERSGCDHPPSGIPRVTNNHLNELLRHTLRRDPYQRRRTSWLAEHPFLRSI